MKEGCQAVSIAMPSEMVLQLDRLPPYNRTRHVVNAVATYLEVQGRPKNRYGIDCDYMRKKMSRIMRDMDDYTPDELILELERMARVLREEKVDAHV